MSALLPNGPGQVVATPVSRAAVYAYQADDGRPAVEVRGMPHKLCQFSGEEGRIPGPEEKRKWFQVTRRRSLLSGLHARLERRIHRVRGLPLLCSIEKRFFARLPTSTLQSDPASLAVRSRHLNAAFHSPASILRFHKTATGSPLLAYAFGATAIHSAPVRSWSPSSALLELAGEINDQHPFRGQKLPLLITLSSPSLPSWVLPHRDQSTRLG